MDITWNIEVCLTSSCGSKTIKVTPNDTWNDINRSGTILRRLKGTETTDITQDNIVFKNIPTHWYTLVN